MNRVIAELTAPTNSSSGFLLWLTPLNEWANGRRRMAGTNRTIQSSSLSSCVLSSSVRRRTVNYREIGILYTIAQVLAAVVTGSPVVFFQYVPIGKSSQLQGQLGGLSEWYGLVVIVAWLALALVVGLYRFEQLDL